MYVSLAHPQPSRRRRRALGDSLPAPQLVGPQILPSLVNIFSPPPPAPGSTDTGLSTPSLLWNWITNGANIGDPNCSFWDIACASKSAMIKAGQAEIQTVPDNAVQYYGAGSPAAVVAQTVATQQEAQVPNDVATMLATNLPVGPLSIPWWVWAGLGVGAFLILTKR